MSDLQESIEHWNKLADEAEKFAEYEESRGHTGVVYWNKAKNCRAAAKSLELERTTGKPHCSCCLKPRGEARK